VGNSDEQLWGIPASGVNDVYQGSFGTVEASTPFTVAVAEIQAVETGG